MWQSVKLNTKVNIDEAKTKQRAGVAFLAFGLVGVAGRKASK